MSSNSSNSSTNNNLLSELVADIAEAIQEGSRPPITDEWKLPRFATVVSDFNKIEIIDSDGKEYVVTITEKEQ